MLFQSKNLLQFHGGRKQNFQVLALLLKWYPDLAFFFFYGTSPLAVLWWSTVYMASVLPWTLSWHFVRWNLPWQANHITRLRSNYFFLKSINGGTANLFFVQCFLYSFQKSQNSLQWKSLYLPVSEFWPRWSRDPEAAASNLFKILKSSPSIPHPHPQHNSKFSNLIFAYWSKSSICSCSWQ